MYRPSRNYYYPVTQRPEPAQTRVISGVLGFWPVRGDSCYLITPTLIRRRTALVGARPGFSIGAPARRIVCWIVCAPVVVPLRRQLREPQLAALVGCDRRPPSAAVAQPVPRARDPVARHPVPRFRRSVFSRPPAFA